MPYDYIPPHIALPIALILWVALFWVSFRKYVRDAVNEYFAERRYRRREQRRMRAYAAMDAAASQKALTPFWVDDHNNTR